MEHGLAESIADGMTLSDQIASVNRFTSNLMLTARFCEDHKDMGDSTPLHGVFSLAARP